jgi:hypothetical protein
MLQNYKKGEVPQLCTAEEIIALAVYSTITSMSRAKEIYSKTLENGKGEAGKLWIFLSALANIYDAGRTQGIREERLKRRV